MATTPKNIENLLKPTCLKLQSLGVPNLACDLILWTSRKTLQIIAMGTKLALLRGSQVLHRFVS